MSGCPLQRSGTICAKNTLVLASADKPRTLFPTLINGALVIATCHLQQHAMSILQYAGRLYSLDTLDSRFTSSSGTPPSRIDPARPSPNDSQSFSTKSRGEDAAKGASPPRWRTPEYMYHGLIFLVAVPLMFKTVYDVSQRRWILTWQMLYFKSRD